MSFRHLCEAAGTHAYIYLPLPSEQQNASFIRGVDVLGFFPASWPSYDVLPKECPRKCGNSVWSPPKGGATSLTSPCLFLSTAWSVDAVNAGLAAVLFHELTLRNHMWQNRKREATWGSTDFTNLLYLPCSVCFRLLLHQRIKPLCL